VQFAVNDFLLLVGGDQVNLAVLDQSFYFRTDLVVMQDLVSEESPSDLGFPLVLGNFFLSEIVCFEGREFLEHFENALWACVSLQPFLLTDLSFS